MQDSAFLSIRLLTGFLGRDKMKVEHIESLHAHNAAARSERWG